MSNRPILCSSSNWEAGEIVVGSSDHALYVLDVESCSQKRCLHSKKSGHREWVTCVAHLKDGSILSGGMDSRLCLWKAETSRSQFLEGANPVKLLFIWGRTSVNYVMLSYILYQLYSKFPYLLTYIHIYIHIVCVHCSQDSALLGQSLQ